MRACLGGGLAVASVLALGALGERANGQEAAPLANARLTHVAIATKDFDRTVKTLAGVLGEEVPAARELTLDAPGNRRVKLKTALFNTANFQIEVDQPMGPGPTQQFVDRFGIGIEHLGFTVNEPLARAVRELERRGGKVTAGSATARYAFLDFMPTLGLTIEVVEQAGATGAPASARRPDALASRTLSHVGLVYRDAQPAVNALADLLGVKAPTMMEFQPIDYRAGVKADPSAHVKFAMMPAGGVNIEVIQPVGEPSPWADFIASRMGAAAPHHIAFTFRPQDDLDAAVRDLQARGGVWKKGQRGVGGEKTGSSPEFEFLDTLGMVIEVSGGGR